MKPRIVILAILAAGSLSVAAAALETAFTYQGRLTESAQGANGNYDLRFQLYDAAQGGVMAAATTNANVAVQGGLFTTVVDFGSWPDNWTAQWLEIAVRTSGSAGGFTVLTPRQALLATPFASYAAAAAAAGSVSGPVNGAQITNLSYSNLSGSVPDEDLSANVALLDHDQVFKGSVTAQGDLVGARLRVGTNHWLNGPWSSITAGVSNRIEAGQSSTIAGGERNLLRSSYTHIGGGTNNLANYNTLRGVIGGGSGNTLQNGQASVIAGGADNTTADSFNSIGGGADNTNAAYAGTIGGGTYNLIGAEAQHGTIAGGSSHDVFAFGATVGGGINNRIGTNAIYASAGGGRENVIEKDAKYAVIGGGSSNVVPARGYISVTGGGLRNTNHSPWGVVGGGLANDAGDGAVATVAGGEANSSMAWRSTVGGGYLNLSSGYAATVAGGEQNTSSGSYAMVPGGLLNVAAGPYSFAAGRRAKALHDGSFVWADDTDANFTSTQDGQFLVRARGGVGLGTANPQSTLHVYSTNNPTVVRIQSTGAPGWGRIEFCSNPQGDANEWRPGYIESVDAGNFTGGLAFSVNGTGPLNKFGIIQTMRIINGRVGIQKYTPVSALDVGGTVTAIAFNPTSDRNLKENLASVNAREVLDKVVAMPISQWNFKEEPAVRHAGPMAQDFHAAFGLGTDDRHIATVDADGVALAAIQGLHAVVQEKDTRIQALQQDVAELKRLVNALLQTAASAGQ